MNADERALLTRFLGELSRTGAGQKDQEAADMIARAMSASPDAAYLLVQHAIVADQSLHAAQARIEELERQASSGAGPSTSSFLPQGGGSSGAWGDRPAYAPPPPDQRPGLFSSGGGLGSFLRSAGTTAAGVAGGEMLFNGLSNLFGRGSGGYGGQGFMGQPEEVIVNNYGDDGYDPGFADSSDPGNW